MKHHFLFLTGWVLIFSLGACEDALLGGDEPQPEPREVFEALWKDVDERYSYFEEKNINWDSLREVYRVRVENDMDELALFDLLAELLFELEDGHVNLSADFDRSRNWEWFLGYPPNFNANIVERKYLGSDFRQIGPMRAQMLDSVLYAYYGSFGSTLTQDHLDALLEMAGGSKGMIIDIRDNGGGSLRNAERLASCLVESSRLYARRRSKTGSAHNDFSPWEEQYIAPRADGPYPGKVAVLTNRSTYSAANAFAQMARVAPRAILVGDRSGGGGGTPAYGELPNGWTYRFSATQSVSPLGEHLEFGVPADLPAALTPEDEQAARDGIIEAALQWLGG